MELKKYSTLIDFEYDGYITCYMVRQLKLYILANPYIDDIPSINFFQNNRVFEKRELEITVLHHAEDDETINTILTDAITYFANNTFFIP